MAASVGDTVVSILEHDCETSQQTQAHQTNPLCLMQDAFRYFLKTEPKALGAVQIMIGIVNAVLGGIVYEHGHTASTIFGWTSALFIISGALSVAACNAGNICLVRASLCMNIISCILATTTVACLTIYIVSADPITYCSSESSPECQNEIILKKTLRGIEIMMLILHIMELFLLLSTYKFTCKAVCRDSFIILPVIQHRQ